MARPKGYARWAPKDDTLRLIEQVQDVLDEYKAHLPLTVRQVFYRLVGAFGYEKTEQAYARLCEHLVRARRAQMISFDDIRDDGTVQRVPQTFEDEAGFWRAVRNDLKHYSRNRQAGQPVAVELWCEAAGMAPQLQRVAFPYSVPVYSTGGFSSVTVTHEIAVRASRRKVPTVFLHVGDFDPSGESIFEAMGMDARCFVRAEVHSIASESGAYDDRPELLAQILKLRMEVPDGLPDLLPKRVALTAEQVEEYDLPTAPPKKSDTRSRSWEGETCQAEAMPPDLLARVVEAALQDALDMDIYEAEAEKEAADEARIAAKLDYLDTEYVGA